MSIVTAPVTVEVRDFGWRHGGRRAWALRGVDLHIEAGERVLLLGPSGGGKSTLLAALAGLLDPADAGEQEGVVLLDGRPARTARARAGLVLQDPESALVMGRAGDDVAFGLENRGVPTAEIWARVDEALGAVGFPYGRDAATAALSGGEQQRLALAGILALRPGLLLLDEVTANLDPDGVALVRGVLARVFAEAGATAVLVEHRVDQVVDLATRAVVLEPGGGVVADGSPAQVFGADGSALAARGVWVPGRHPVVRRKARAAPDGEAEHRTAADAPPELVRADGVRFRYPGAATDALAGADLVLGAGRATALTGPNGAGKSTLALAMAGLLRPSSGQVRAGAGLDPPPSSDLLRGRSGPDRLHRRRGSDLLRGRSGPDLMHRRRGSDLLHPRRRTEATVPLWRWRGRDLVTRIGTVFQHPEHQIVASTVRAELLVGPLRSGATEAAAAARADELLERLGLAGLAEANPYTLSGGEKRRLSVATAIATAPALVVADEPTFGQDSRTWVELVELLADLRDAGTGLLLVTHDPALVEAIADVTVALEPAPTPEWRVAADHSGLGQPLRATRRGSRPGQAP